MKPAVLFLFLIIAASCIVIPVSAEVYYSASTPQIITKGDSFTVSGTGADNGTMALWIIGRKYFDVRTATPDRNGNFSFIYKPTDTMKFWNGQYAVVLQDPGMSHSLQIEPGRDSGGNLTIMNRGKIVFRLGAKDDLMGNVQTETGELLSTAQIQGVDDTFRARYFNVEDPAVHFDNIIPASDSRLPDMISGDRIVITGTTNLGTDDIIRSAVFNNDNGVLVTTKDLVIIPGTSLNQWMYVVEEPGLEDGNYRITLRSENANTTGTDTAYFAVKKEPVTGGIPGLPVGPVQHDGEAPLPEWLDTLLILGILFVGAVVIYTLTKD